MDRPRSSMVPALAPGEHRYAPQRHSPGARPGATDDRGLAYGIRKDSASPRRAGNRHDRPTTNPIGEVAQLPGIGWLPSMDGTFGLASTPARRRQGM